MAVTVVPCAGLTLNAFLDLNSNGTEDNGEPKFPLGHFNYEVNDDGIIHHAASANGMVSLSDYSATNTYDVTFTIDAPDDVRYNITTPSYTNITTGDPHPVYNFPVTVVQAYDGLQVTLVPIDAPRTGSSYYVNSIVYTNNGNTTLSGSITFSKAAVLSILSVSELGVTNTANGFSFDFVNLLPFETRYISVVMSVPAIPIVSLGQLITNSVSITNTAATVADSSSVTQAIIGAYDPNDKTESHGSEILFSTFTSEEYLFYTLRFENTGNANALDVRLTDNLDAKLDETSVRLVGASHDYIMERVGSNLEFRFNNIQLPPSVAETNVGKGYVTFKVKPKPGFAIGDIIPNSASIYFDTNPAIETNTFETEFVNQLGTENFKNTSFSIYPNPASHEFTVVSSQNTLISAINIYDVIGKAVLLKTVKSDRETIDIRSLVAGMYLVEIVSGETRTIRKLLVK